MASRIREAIGPLYLFACLLLGGSAQGIWGNMALQLLGLAIIAWAAWHGSGPAMAPAARQLLVLAMLAIALVALQSVPLPASIWTHLGGRGPAADGYRLLGLGAPSLPVSLAPYRSFEALLALIPPLALFCAIVGLQGYRPSWLAAGLLAGTIAGVVLGALQVTATGGDIASSSWYLYEETSYGFATGFFANANHMADLLACTLPFLAAVLWSARAADRQRKSAMVIAVVAAALLVLAGIALNHSLAVYGLTPPVLVASALILLPPRSRWRRWTLVAAMLLLVGGVAALASSSVRGSAFAGDTVSSVENRQEMLTTTGRAIGDFMPSGSGLGSFQSVYHLYEDPTKVNGTYVIHAHNDYAELALETGLPGILLIAAFLLWWARQLWSAWSYRDGGSYARAASIASAAILVHSVVDFPLRTAAISGVFAMCLALLVERRVTPVRSKSDLRPTRHVVLR
jgi:O-antigen ligase